jgi:flagellar basal body rod protein FlgB
MNVAGLVQSAAADNVANMDTEGYEPWKLDGSGTKGQPGTVDLADNMVGVMTSSVAYKANARAVEIGAETQSSLFDRRV